MRLTGFKLTETHVEQLMKILSSLEDVHFDISTNIPFPDDATDEEVKAIVNKKLLGCVQQWLDNVDIEL